MKNMNKLIISTILLLLLLLFFLRSRTDNTIILFILIIEILLLIIMIIVVLLHFTIYKNYFDSRRISIVDGNTLSLSLKKFFDNEENKIILKFYLKESKRKNFRLQCKVYQHNELISSKVIMIDNQRRRFVKKIVFRNLSIQKIIVLVNVSRDREKISLKSKIIS